MFIKDEIIAEAQQLIINTRDLCGNEREAVLDFLASDHGIRGEDAVKVYRIANFRANKEWDGWKRQAGVAPKYRML